MSTEPTRAHYSANWFSKAKEARSELDSYAEPASESPHAPVQEAATATETSGTGSDRGTGGREAHGRPEATIPAELLECNPRTVIHLTAEDMARGPLTIEVDHATLLRAEPDYPPATIPNQAMPYLAGFINALKAAHYREAAASLRLLGHDAAADRLDSTAKDLTDLKATS